MLDECLCLLDKLLYVCQGVLVVRACRGHAAGHGDRGRGQWGLPTSAFVGVIHIVKFQRHCMVESEGLEVGRRWLPRGRDCMGPAGQTMFTSTSQ